MAKTDLKHIGFIMDGNGRWAKAKGLTRPEGHQKGSQALQDLIKVLAEDDEIEQVSIYAFSTENWNRPALEVQGLMKLFKKFATDYLEEMVKNSIEVRILGDLSESSPFSKDLRQALLNVNDIDIQNPKLRLNLCINYGGRDEIVRATNTLIQRNEEITDETLTKEILKDDLPLDLVVRTSGEQRISGFLLWQCAYAEFLFVDYHWPDIDAEKFAQIKDSFKHRDRRFGAIEE